MRMAAANRVMAPVESTVMGGNGASGSITGAAGAMVRQQIIPRASTITIAVTATALFINSLIAREFEIVTASCQRIMLWGEHVVCHHRNLLVPRHSIWIKILALT